MPIRLNAVIEIPDEELSRLAEALAENRLLPTAGALTLSRNSAIPVGADQVELPPSWRLLETQHGVRYTWPEPEGPDIYDPFRIYEGVTSGGTIRLAIGECERTMVRDEERKYFIAGHIAASGSFRPIAEFLATDDHEESGETIAIIKGREGSAKMYDPDDELPPIYHQFQIETYRDRVDKPRSYSKLGILANENDAETMLAHTLIQAQSRLGIAPS